MMSLNLTNANASLSHHAIRNSNAASVPSASFLRKQSCYICSELGGNYINEVEWTFTLQPISGVGQDVLIACNRTDTSSRNQVINASINLLIDWSTQIADSVLTALCLRLYCFHNIEYEHCHLISNTWIYLSNGVQWLTHLRVYWYARVLRGN